MNAGLAVGFMDNAIEVYALELPSAGASPASTALVPMLRVRLPQTALTYRAFHASPRNSL
jgi:hypothetical protein